ncbi:hypothetical protein ACHAWT_010484 [Skeletonema menzelii]|mmetsp:Transcript_25627/g.41661  ORF Transcript_25627/g.41661 Transcript_25627/m.41661 type:complete len:540 (+) Transcript_25627:24-1643(+)
MSRMASSGRGYGQRGYRSDQSYFTETSSVTNPPELLGIVEDEDDDDVISYISETSALTGWTAENSAAIAPAPAPRPPRSTVSSALGAITESVSEEDSRMSPKSYFGDGVSSFGESMGASFAASGISNAGRSLSPRNNALPHRPTFMSDESSLVSNASKKRAPVPQLRNPDMEDTEEDQMWEEECNCDINPTPLYQAIISKDWKHVTDLLDGQEEDPVWSLPGLTGFHQLMPTVGVKKTDVGKMKDYQNKLRQQARTWIMNRQRGSGVLKWRMLPIHIAVTYQAPFDVVLRLYHLYPGSVRCRDHRGMLPLHICFFRGAEDRVLEMFMDVFPDALDVKDDKGRSAIECTPQDGSENERRSNIMNMFLKYMMEKQEMIRLQEKVKEMHKPVVKPVFMTEEPDTSEAHTLGATPRFSVDDTEKSEAAEEEKVNTLMLNAFKLMKPKTPKKGQKKVKFQSEDEVEEEKSVDKYSIGEGENTPKNNGNQLRLTPIDEDGLAGKIDNITLDENIEVLESDLVAFGKKKKKGIRKMFGKKSGLSYH